MIMRSYLRQLKARLKHHLRHRGVKGTLGVAIHLAQIKLYLDETHVWYELALGNSRPQKTLRPGLKLIRSGADDLPLLEELPTVSAYGARWRMKAGHDLWLVLDDRQPIFACWIFHDSVPILAARKGQLTLPPDTVCLEDSITSPSYRGRGIVAPAAWSQVADSLEKAGVKSIITKVEAENKAMRWALAKSGFCDIAIMRFRKAGLRRYIAVRAKAGATADWLVEQLLR
jgi:RimJ/RimL family protein N-acetyltransferase